MGLFIHLQTHFPKILTQNTVKGYFRHQLVIHNKFSQGIKHTSRSFGFEDSVLTECSKLYTL